MSQFSSIAVGRGIAPIILTLGIVLFPSLANAQACPFDVIVPTEYKDGNPPTQQGEGQNGVTEVRVAINVPSRETTRAKCIDWSAVPVVTLYPGEKGVASLGFQPDGVVSTVEIADMVSPLYSCRYAGMWRKIDSSITTAKIIVANVTPVALTHSAEKNAVSADIQDGGVNTVDIADVAIVTGKLSDASNAMIDLADNDLPNTENEDHPNISIECNGTPVPEEEIIPANLDWTIYCDQCGGPPTEVNVEVDINRHALDEVKIDESIVDDTSDSTEAINGTAEMIVEEYILPSQICWCYIEPIQADTTLSIASQEVIEKSISDNAPIFIPEVQLAEEEGGVVTVDIADATPITGKLADLSTLTRCWFERTSVESLPASPQEQISHNIPRVVIEEVQLLEQETVQAIEKMETAKPAPVIEADIR